MATRHPVSDPYRHASNQATRNKQPPGNLTAIDDPDAATDAATDAALDAIVAAAPPLPYQVKARLAFLLGGRDHAPHNDKTA